MPDSIRTLAGRLTAPDVTLPDWAVDHLHLALWDRDHGPESAFLHAPLHGPTGAFSLALDEESTLKLAMIGHRAGAQHVASIGWGKARDPILAHLPWPKDWPDKKTVTLGWNGWVMLIGYVEQIHIQEIGGLPLAVLEFCGRAAPITYRRLPPLPQSADGDRHGLHTDRHLEDSPEQVAYLLADAESPLAAAAQDALVSSLQVVCVASLGAQDARWHEVVNVPLLLDALTLIGP